MQFFCPILAKKTHPGFYLFTSKSLNKTSTCNLPRVLIDENRVHYSNLSCIFRFLAAF